MRRGQVMWLGGILLAAGVLIFAWGVMRDMDERLLERGGGIAGGGLGLLLLYGMFGKPKRNPPPTSNERPA